MEIDKKFNCDCCKYKTDKPSDWLKHLNCKIYEVDETHTLVK